MKRSFYALLLLASWLFFCCLKISAQGPTDIHNQIISFPEDLFKKINAKAEGINNKLVKESGKYLDKMAKEERKLRRKLLRRDAGAAKKIFLDSDNQYAMLQQKIKHASNLRKKYLPHLDSLLTALEFLDKTEALLEKSPQTDIMLKEAILNLDLLKENFSKVDNIQQVLAQRQKFLQAQTAAYGLPYELRKFQKQLYYYQEQVAAYKRAFDTPSLIEQRAMAIIRKTTMFKKFFKEHSQLAGLFRLPETSQGNTPVGFAAFQTRQGVEVQLLQRYGYLPDLQQLAARQTDESLAPFSRLKNEATNSSSGQDELKIPNFTPNSQKARSFIRRFEIGANLQTVKSNNFFPSTTDLALSIGYKINDRSTLGIGSAYKMGWGKDIGHIAITHQGIGLRSFLDIKIKGNFWLSGGAEMNYRSRFSNFEILNDYSPWQKSALIGFSKKYRVSKKVKGNMQLMYDFISTQQVPRTQPLVFRIGYVW